MPRASNPKRQQGAANPRDTRHENGLVGPGKRVSARKTQQQQQQDSVVASRTFDKDAPNGCSPSQNGLSSSPATNNQQDNGHANGNGNGLASKAHQHNNSNASAMAAHDAAVRSSDSVPRRASLGSYSETSSADTMSTSAHGSHGSVETQQHRQIDVNASKNADVHRDPGGPLEFAATVLRALPLSDTLAILILLMQVPTVALSGIYMAFTFLTFVPPVTTSSGMNINLAEIFDNTSTMPSLVTTLCMDFFIMLVWLFLMPPVQAAILDLAKPVIAVTLGGGSSSKEGTSRSMTTCFLLVIVSHLLRGTRYHWTRAVHLLPLPSKWKLSPDFDDPLEAMEVFEKRGPHNWVKSVLAIHILTQGIVRYIREWYLRRERSSSSSQGLPDPEAGKPAEASADSSYATADAESAAQQHATISNNKKRRKQSTQVRLQQPLWAALASTKIVMVKEYELSHAASETAASNATDIHNLGNAPFDSQAEQIWISYVGADEVCFNTSHFEDGPASAPNGHATRRSEIDRSKPFYVRVNNAPWQPTRIYRVEDDEEDDEDIPGHRWCGDIYGLRPLSKYVCEFVDSRTDRVIFSTSIRTTQPVTKDQEALASPAINGKQSLRPDSPTTTLKSTISAQNERLVEEKSKLKTLRKDWKSKVSSLKKENEKLDNAIQSGGNNDDKLRQKVIQQETQKSQAETEIAGLNESLKSFEKTPEDLLDRKKQAEKGWSSEKAIFDKASKEFKDFKSKLASEIKSNQDEQSSLQTKRSKIAARIAKVDTELGRITDANNRGLDEAERRRQGRTVWETETKTIENNFKESIGTIQTNNLAKQTQVNSLMTQLQAYHEQMNFTTSGGASGNNMPFDGSMGPQPYGPAPAPAPNSHANGMPSSTSWNPNPAAPPHYPASMWQTSNAMPPATTAGGSGSLLPAQAVTAAPWQPSAPAFLKTRGRSSSMLSDVSGFTQSSAGDEEYMSVNNTPGGPSQPAQQPPARPQLAHLRRGQDSGSGSSVRSGSDNGGGSVHDPTSPV